jgi:hypothetical protein
MTRTKDQAAAVLPTLLKALRLPSINRNWKVSGVWGPRFLVWSDYGTCTA